MKNEKTRILFFAEPATLAHITRPYFLANKLSQQRFEIFFATNTRHYQSTYRNAHFPVIHMESRSPEQFQAILEKKGMLFDAEVLRTYIKEDLRLMEEIKPDCVIGDLRLSLPVSGPKSGTKVITVTNAYWSPYGADKTLPAFFSEAAYKKRWSRLLSNRILQKETRQFNDILPFVYASQVSGINAVRKENGLEIFDDYLEAYTWGDAVLYSDIPEITPLQSLPLHHHYVGSTSLSLDVPLPDWWNAEIGEKKYILVCLGSSGVEQMTKPVLEACKKSKELVVFVSAGKRIEGSLPSNILVVDFLPLERALQGAKVFITNGGSPTSYLGMASGVPVLGLPFNMDQLLCMKWLSKTGACIDLRADRVHTKSVLQNIQLLLSDMRYRAAAKQLQQHLNPYDASVILPRVISDVCSGIGKLIGNIG